MRIEELLEIRILLAIVTKKSMHALEHRFGLAGSDISGLQFGMMRMLSFEEQTISELSHKLMLDPSTLVPAADALERKGFVKRGRDPNDRRRVPLSLTEGGVEFVSRVPVVDQDDILFKSLNQMGDVQAHQLLTLLRELVRYMPEGEDILQGVSARVHLHVACEAKRCDPAHTV